MKKIQEKLQDMFKGCYGIDELGKTIFILSVVLYFWGTALNIKTIISLGTIGLFIEIFRMASKQTWDRSEENRKYMEILKLWKLKYENRAGYRVYRCKRCGCYIRIPKGKGKIQVKCKKCGTKTIHRT